MSSSKLISLSLITCVALCLCATASAEERIVVKGFEARQNNMSLQLHGGALSISDDLVDPEGNANLGGLGLSWRWDLVDWGGLEVSLHALGRNSESGLITETRGLFTVSWLWYFAHKHNHHFYGITGLGGLSTDLEAGPTSYEYSESALVLGVGSEWLTSNNWVFSVDVRALMLEDDGSGTITDTDIGPAPDSRTRTPFPDEWGAPPESRVGMMLNVGLGYRW